MRRIETMSKVTFFKRGIPHAAIYAARMANMMQGLDPPAWIEGLSTPIRASAVKAPPPAPAPAPARAEMPRADEQTILNASLHEWSHAVITDKIGKPIESIC